ncbi:MAG: hypothetical protein KDA89_10520, partial [Planctomycetaceae bacterium]|nr:hypothetical protein [Planctomycetaceae bacterium]
MVMKTSPCTSSLVSCFLRDELDGSQQHMLEEHLTDCDYCREHLETSVAGMNQWEELRSALNSDDGASSGVAGDSAGSDHLTEDADASKDAGEFCARLLSPSDDPQMLGRIGPYEISEVIGHGGMGVVF